MKKLIKILFVLFLIVIITGISLPTSQNYFVTDKQHRIIDIQGCTYWITKSSGKRHNSSCRWYKKSKGYCTDEKIGKACKICGG